MKPFIFSLSLITVLLAGCSGETIMGPEEDGRVLEPAGACSINAKLC